MARKINKDVLRVGAAQYKEFCKLPERAKVLFFDLFFNSDETPFNVIDFEVLDSNSPMEQLFDFAFKYYLLQYPLLSCVFLDSQYLIKCEEHNYYADFHLMINCEGEFCETKLLIEIDGHDFHEKTKEQVAKDKERELNIKMQGYDIIRFSGSQVYNDPIDCVKKTIMYAIKRGALYGRKKDADKESY